MLSFALVVAKPGRTVPPTVFEALGERSPADLPTDAESHIRWSDDHGRTVFAGWQAAADHLGVGSHWEVRPGGLTAFSGHLWRRGVPWRSSTSWAAQLADRCEQVPLVASLEDWHGVYTAISVSASGDGCIVADPLAFGALYWGESDDIVVVSTRSSLTARLITPPGRRAPRDAEAIASIAYCTWVLGNRTGFVGVQTVPPGSYVMLSAAGAPEVRTWAPRPWLPAGDEDVDDIPALVDRVREELAASLRAYAHVPAKKRVNLSGGRDSRLVLAILLSEGLADQFAYTTFGSPELADCIVATAIADRYGLEHQAASRRQPNSAVLPGAFAPVSYEQRLRHHVWVTSGLISTWDLQAWSRQRSPDMIVTGLFGEAYRTIYPGKSHVTSMDVLYGQVRERGFGYDNAGILTPDARKHYDAEIVAALEAALPDGGTPQDALDGFYLGGRLRRWIGPQQDCQITTRLAPLYSLTATRAAFALGPQKRWSDVLMFEIMRAACDELATMPFATTRWPEAAIAHLPDADRYRTSPPTDSRPVRPTTNATSVNQESNDKSLDEKIPVLRAQLDLGADHPLFDIFDRAALLSAVDDFHELSHTKRRAVHGAINAAMWMSESEAPAVPAARHG